MSERSPDLESEINSFCQTELLETPDITIKMVTETPKDGVAYRESYCDPCLIVNFGAQLDTFEVEGNYPQGTLYGSRYPLGRDRAGGYKGAVIPGDFSFLPSNSVLEGYYQGEMLCYAYLMFPQERLNSRYSEEMLIMKSDPLIQQFARSLFAHRHRNDPDIILYRDSMSEALIQHLQLVHLDRVTSEFDRRPNLDRLESYIRANLNQKLTVGQLAKLEQTTPKLLQKAVRNKHYCSVYEWITTLRLERSLLLLRNSNLHLTNIALETGFANQSHWTRLFRRQFGITPGKLRSRSTRSY